MINFIKDPRLELTRDGRFLLLVDAFSWCDINFTVKLAIKLKIIRTTK